MIKGERKAIPCLFDFGNELLAIEYPSGELAVQVIELLLRVGRRVAERCVRDDENLWRER